MDRNGHLWPISNKKSQKNAHILRVCSAFFSIFCSTWSQIWPFCLQFSYPLKLLQNELHWKPSASIESLKKRAQILGEIRKFFAARNILEVETPILCQHAVTDVFIESFSSLYKANPLTKTYFLQTSPEYAMKRLLANGSGSIFQICKAFRNGEYGTFHNPEFTMLEWYQVGLDHYGLMQELDIFFQDILHAAPAIKISYAELFAQHFSLNPHTCTMESLEKLVQKKISGDKDTLLNYLFAQIEAQLGLDAPLMIYDFPASQAALARLRKCEDYQTADRFEVYIHGIEIANGFYELTDAEEQKKRFERDQKKRAALNLTVPEIDMYFLAALEQGLPDCAGVALGIDRLMMVALQADSIREVISFSWGQA